MRRVADLCSFRVEGSQRGATTCSSKYPCNLPQPYFSGLRCASLSRDKERVSIELISSVVVCTLRYPSVRVKKRARSFGCLLPYSLDDLHR
jgi:hypothetical protein